MNNKTKKWTVVIILVIVEIMAQYSLNYSIKSKQQIYKYIGIILYALSGYYYYKLLELTKNLGIANILWTCGTFIGITFLAITINKEKMSWQKIIASILIVIALILYGN